MQTDPTPPDDPQGKPSSSLRWLLTGAVLTVIAFVAGRFSAESPLSPQGYLGAASQAVPAPFPSLTEFSRSQESWNASWAQLLAQPRSPSVDKTTAAALEELAETDPEHALAIVRQEQNRLRRAIWLHATLRGWARTAPTAAAALATGLPFAEREEALQAVMDGAVRNPTSAVALADRLVSDNPANARSYANHLLRVLSESGEFERAVAFTSRLPSEIRAEMLGTAFQYWSLSQPERAFAQAATLVPGESRSVALDAAVSGWAQGDPSGLAEFALGLQATDDRAAVLQTALREWVLVNPKAASDWIDRFDPKPELDAGAAAVAQHPDVIARQPEIAASWAESITQPVLKSATLMHVLREWAARDSSAALAYAKNATALPPADRAALLKELAEAQ